MIIGYCRSLLGQQKLQVPWQASWLAAALCLLAGCSSLDTTYGTTDERKESLQGFVVLRQQLDQHFDVRPNYLMADRLQDASYTTLIHANRNSNGPDTEVMEWLIDWLQAEPDRTAVLLMRHAGIASHLCREWADQALAESRGNMPEATKAQLRSVAGNLRLRAGREEEEERDYHFTPEQRHFYYNGVEIDFTTVPGGYEPHVHGTWTIGAETAPAFLSANYAITPSDKTTTLLGIQNAKNQKTYTIGASTRVGSSNLIIFTTSTPFLDGALPDPTNRLITEHLMQALEPPDSTAEKPKLAWVRNLRVGTGAEAQTNILAMVFTQPPVSYIIWHLTALLILFLLWKNRWLGRREQPIETDHQHFLRHVESLAKHLKDDQAGRDCAQAIATLRGAGQAPAGQDDLTYRRWLDSSTVPHAEKTAHKSKKSKQDTNKKETSP